MLAENQQLEVKKQAIELCLKKYAIPRNPETDFKPDRRFHSIKKELEDQRKYGEKFCKVNYLDVIGKSGSQKKFYNPEILKEFDKHYTKRKPI